jgi:hypothetical protein
MSDESNKTSKPDLMQALREVGEELARQLKDATAVNIETYITVVGERAGEELVASTSIELDGDTKMLVPVRREGNTLVRDVELLQLHQLSVDNAIAYRAKLVDRIMEVARQVRSR